jgi:hypothetical protein
VSLKTVVLTLLSVAVAAVVFCAGCFLGQRDEQRRFVAFQLRVDLALYHAAETGDMAHIKEQLGTALVARTRTYEVLFPKEHSSKLFLEARRISTEIEGNRGPMIEVPSGTPPK